MLIRRGPLAECINSININRIEPVTAVTCPSRDIIGVAATVMISLSSSSGRSSRYLQSVEFQCRVRVGLAACILTMERDAEIICCIDHKAGFLDLATESAGWVIIDSETVSSSSVIRIDQFHIHWGEATGASFVPVTVITRLIVLDTAHC